ncbi:MAG: hypothetical protein WC767_00895 [Candidatus Paceibacterota bacterium]|jgi:hypothetical protein
MNKKGLFAVIIIIILAIAGYYAFGSKPSTSVEDIGAPSEVKADVPAGVTKDTFAPVTKDSTDTSLIGRLKSVSVGVTEDGSKVTLADGKATFTIPGSSSKGSVSLGDVAISKDSNGRKDVLAILNVSSGGSGTFQYVVLFEDKGGVLTDKSYVSVGDRVTVTGIRADDISAGGDYVVSVSYLGRKDGEPMTAKATVAKTKILVVAGGAFDLSKTIDL